MATNFNAENDRFKAAQKRVKEIKGFYTHLLVYLLVNIFLIVGGSREGVMLSGFLDLSNYITAFFWGIGLLAHWATVFGSNFFLGKKWEEKKIQEFMEQEKIESKRWE